MNIETLSARAMEIRSRFAELEESKFRRQWTKEEVMQGFVVDVGDLMKLVMAKSGIREVEELDKKLAHELSDCLWCVLVLSKLYGIDLGREFMKTMDQLDGWIAVTKAQVDPARSHRARGSASARTTKARRGGSRAAQK